LTDFPKEIEDNIKYSAILKHQDRIFIGVNTLFVFRYPAMRLKLESIQSENP
jgi:hypothetical protein